MYRFSEIYKNLLYILALIFCNTINCMNPVILEIGQSNELNMLHIAWAPKQHYLAVTYLNNECKIWDINAAKPIKTLTFSSTISAIAWSTANELAIGLNDGTIEIWNIEVGRLTTYNQNARIVKLVWSPCGRYLAFYAKKFLDRDIGKRLFENNSTIGFIKRFSLDLQVETLNLPYHITSFAWSACGPFLAIAQSDIDEDDHWLSIYSFKQPDNAKSVICSEERKYKLPAYISSLQWSPTDNRLAALLANNSIFIFNAAKIEALWFSSKKNKFSVYNSISWSYDGLYLITGCFDQIDLWNSFTGKIDKSLEFNEFESLNRIKYKLSPLCLACAPNFPCFAACLKEDVASVFYGHILAIFDMHQFYPLLNKLILRERLGKMMTFKIPKISKKRK